MQAEEIEREELYAEPSYFYQPARQCEGAILLQQGRFDEAARVYREVRKVWGWCGKCGLAFWLCCSRGDLTRRLGFTAR